MATSGTVGQTVITTDKLLDHAFRRCGLSVAQQTPESVEASKESLFMLLVHLANRGLNLWCVEKHYLPVSTAKAKYALPTGTLSVLNVLHSRPTYSSGSESSDGQTLTLTLDTESTLTKLLLNVTTLPTTTVTIESSDDGSTWTTVITLDVSDFASGKNYFDFETAVTCSFIRAGVSSGSFDGSISAVTETRDLPVTIMSRDFYVTQPLKDNQSDYPTDFFFEKNLNPSLTLWPVPNSSDNFLTVWIHRQVQDVGMLSQQLAIPTRWLESITRQLAFSVSMEMPGVDPNRITLLKGLADEAVITAELDETDMAPIMIAPRIGAYTR